MRPLYTYYTLSSTSDENVTRKYSPLTEVKTGEVPGHKPMSWEYIGKAFPSPKKYIDDRHLVFPGERAKVRFDISCERVVEEWIRKTMPGNGGSLRFEVCVRERLQEILDFEDTKYEPGLILDANEESPRRDSLLTAQITQLLVLSLLTALPTLTSTKL